MTMENINPLDAYRIDVQGNTRSDYGACVCALNDQCNMITLVNRAISELSCEVSVNEHAQVLAAASDALRGVAATMNAALTTMADCEGAR